MYAQENFQEKIQLLNKFDAKTYLVIQIFRKAKDFLWIYHAFMNVFSGNQHSVKKLYVQSTQWKCYQELHWYAIEPWKRNNMYIFSEKNNNKKRFHDLIVLKKIKQPVTM